MLDRLINDSVGSSTYLCGYLEPLVNDVSLMKISIEMLCPIPWKQENVD